MIMNSHLFTRNKPICAQSLLQMSKGVMLIMPILKSIYPPFHFHEHLYAQYSTSILLQKHFISHVSVFSDVKISETSLAVVTKH